MKRRNPKFGYLKIAEQICHTFGLDIDKDVVRRVLATHYRPDDSGCDGPSWLTLITQAKDSLWSIDILRCESILLRSDPQVPSNIQRYFSTSFPKACPMRGATCCHFPLPSPHPIRKKAIDRLRET